MAKRSTSSASCSCPSGAKKPKTCSGTATAKTCGTSGADYPVCNVFPNELKVQVAQTIVDSFVAQSITTGIEVPAVASTPGGVLAGGLADCPTEPEELPDTVIAMEVLSLRFVAQVETYFDQFQFFPSRTWFGPGFTSTDPMPCVAQVRCHGCH